MSCVVVRLRLYLPKVKACLGPDNFLNVLIQKTLELITAVLSILR